MFDLDHMLNGKGSRQHHQDMIREAQHTRFAREVKPVSVSSKITTPLRVVLVAIINLVLRSF